MRRLAVLGSLVVIVLQGCGSDHSEQIVDLQKQLSLLSRQVEEDRKELILLREADNGLRQSLDAAEAELNRLKALETPPPQMAKGRVAEEELEVSSVQVLPGRHSARSTSLRGAGAAATAQPKSSITCSQVWTLIGQGRSAAEAAKALQTTVERVQSCEQQVGRSRVR